MEDGRKIKVFRKFIEYYKRHKAFPENEIVVDGIKVFLKSLIIFLVFGTMPTIGTFGYAVAGIKDNVASQGFDGFVILLQYILVFATFSITYYQVVYSLNFFKKSTDYTFGKPKQYERTIEILDQLTSISYYWTIFIVVAYFFYALTQNPFCDRQENRMDHRYVCNAMQPLWFPIEIENYFFITFLILSNLIVAVVYFPTFTILPIVIVGSIRLVTLKMRHLAGRVQKLSKEDNSDILQTRFFTCIEYHSAIMDLLSDLNNGISYAILPVYSMLPFQIGLLGYQTIRNGNAMACVNMLPWLFNVSIMCMSGQSLQNEASILEENVANLPWEKMDKKWRKNYLIFLGKVGRPVNLEVRPLANLNNVLLLSIFKACYNFLMFLVRIR